VRITLAFVAFGAVAPAVGALLGREASALLAARADLVAAILLAVVGLVTLRSGFRIADLEATARRFSRGAGLLALAASVSSDNLAVGFGLGLHGADVLPLALACGVSVGVLTASGLRVGTAARERWERFSLVAAGLLLIGLAAAILLGWP
jgi:putative Mn2+ efflux pump MntP